MLPYILSKVVKNSFLSAYFPIIGSKKGVYSKGNKIQSIEYNREIVFRINCLEKELTVNKEAES